MNSRQPYFYICLYLYLCVYRYSNRRGVSIGETYILLDCRMMTGRKYLCGHGGAITLEKQWARDVTTFAYQTAVKVSGVNDAYMNE